MRLEIINNTINVILSQRNLKTLLAKLNDPESSKQLLLTANAPNLDEDFDLIVKAEDDDTHYSSENRLRSGAPPFPGVVKLEHCPTLKEIKF